MFILAILLLTKFESVNLCNLDDRWTLGFNGVPIGTGYNSYFVSLRFLKTFTVGIQGGGGFSRQVESSDSLDLQGWGFGISVLKYFNPASPVSSLISMTPEFSYANIDPHGKGVFENILNYRIIFDAGLEYFFACWGKNLSVQVKTSIINASATYDYKNYYNSYTSNSIKEGISLYLPFKGDLSTFVYIHF